MVIVLVVRMSGVDVKLHPGNTWSAACIYSCINSGFSFMGKFGALKPLNEKWTEEESASAVPNDNFAPKKYKVQVHRTSSERIEEQ